jgi:hypothetical protein
VERRKEETGMALLAVVAVLIALVLIATPFALQMQSAAERSRTLLYTEQADQEAANLFALANLYLLNGVDEVERRNASQEAKTIFATPDYDVAEEFQIPLEVINEFNNNSAVGRIWDVRIEDEQAKLNVNSAPYTALANLLGVTTLAEDLEEGDTDVRLSDGSKFPPDGGVVRVGAELISYERAEGGRLYGVERGYKGSEPWNSSDQTWKKGEVVTNAAAFEIASFPFRAGNGYLRPYKNSWEIKRISELGTAALDPDTFEQASEYLTCDSGREIGGGWSNSQIIRSSLPSSTTDGTGDEVYVDTPNYFGIGTVVRITDGRNTDYGVVLDNNGRKITLGSKVEHDYEVGEARMESMARHPVNINSASDEVLVACLRNVRLRLRGAGDWVTEDEASSLIPRLREEPIKSLYQYKEILREAQSAQIISQQDYYALYMNALNPQDYRLGFSTVPFCFKSFDTYTVKATAVVNSKVGQEIARKTIRRVVSVNPRQSAVWELQTQADFEQQIIASRDAKWMMTYPYNTGGHYEGYNIPPSRVVPHLFRDIWPSDSTEKGIGDVRLAPERISYTDTYHYDESHYSDGFYIREASLAYSTRDARVHLVDDQGMMASSLDFWYRPFWGGLTGQQYIFDTGEETWTNRVALYLDPQEQEIVLRVADATLEKRASETRYKVDAGQIIDEAWYHIGASVTGSRPGDLTIMVDGRVVGEAAHMTRTTQAIQRTDDLSELYVENADSFPEWGALLLRGPDGTEIIEYDGKSTESFKVTRRFARERDSVVSADDHEGRYFDEGTVVELLGYSSPLLSDIPAGGASLNTELSLFHAMRVVFEEDVIYLPGEDDEGGGGGGGIGGSLPGGEPPNVATIQDGGAGIDGGGDTSGGGTEIRGIGPDRSTVKLDLGSGIKAWDSTYADSDALKAFGDSGFALLVSTRIQLTDEEMAVIGFPVGGAEIVTYEKTGNGLTITRFQETDQIAPPDEQYFVPMHSYGNDAETVDTDIGGISSALIPISVEGSGGSSSDYLSIHDEELQHEDIAATRCFAQIGTEWFAYTYPDTETSAGKVLFVWDRPSELQSVVAMFGAGSVGASSVAGGDSPDLPGLPDSGEGGPPDDDNPDPEPPSPPPPDGGGIDDGGPGGGSSNPPPLTDDPGSGDGGPGGGSSNPPPLPDDPGGDDGGPGGGSTNPPVEPDDPGGDDGGPGGTTNPPTPPTPPEDDGGPGSGGGGSTEPPGEEEEPPSDGGTDDGNQADPQPDEGAGNTGGIGDDIPFSEEQIASTLRHRPYGDYLVADTKALEYSESGTEIIPAFIMASYHNQRPGFDDAVTLCTTDGPQEEQVIQHSYFRTGVQYWVAFKEFAASRMEHSSDSIDWITNGSVNTRTVNRVLKFPSGELPDALGSQVHFGSRFDGGGVSSAFIDELTFHRDINDIVYRVGDGDALVADDEEDDNDLGFEEGSKTANMDASQTEIYIHMNPTAGNPDGLPITDLETDCGVLKVEDELIFYRELDTATGKLSGCERGVANTEAKPHAFDAPLTEMEGARVALLDGGLSSSAAEIPLNRIDNFPRAGGYVRIGDELIGYTRIEGNSLIMPRLIRKGGGSGSTAGGFGQPADGDVDAGEGSMRGRFGTVAGDYQDKEIVRFFPARYPDRYTERSAHPETSGIILRKRVDGAIWKRVAWDEKIADNMDVVVLVRFDGTPDWDSENIYNVNEHMVASGTSSDFAEDPKSFLYLIENPHDVNRLHPNGGIQADVLEVKVTFQYLAGAFDHFIDPPANSWKDTPWLKALRAEYVAPVTVHYSEEIR